MCSGRYSAVVEGLPLVGEVLDQHFVEILLESSRGLDSSLPDSSGCGFAFID
jgi:hypothetical protein